MPDLPALALGNNTKLVVVQSAPSLLNSLKKAQAPLFATPVSPLFKAELEAVTREGRVLKDLVAYLARPSVRGVGALALDVELQIPQVKIGAISLRRGALARLLEPRAMAIKNLALETVLMAKPRVKVSPSLLGLGLDEGRLVRNSASKLVDPAVVNTKLEAITTPSPWGAQRAPFSLLGLGWSSSASLANYPSFKASRGLILRRPYTGARGGNTPFEGLKEAFIAPLLGKNNTSLMGPALSLWRNTETPFLASAPSLDTQIGY